MNYLKYIFELYLTYMKIALLSMALSAVALIAYSAIKTDNLVKGVLVVIFIAWIVVGLSFVFFRIRNLKQESGKIDSIEIERRESERRRAEISTEKPNILAKTIKRNIEDLQDAVLVHEVALLIGQLQSLNVGKDLIEKAVEDFLDLQETTDNTLPFIRELVFNSIQEKLATNQSQKEEEDRKVVG